MNHTTPLCFYYVELISPVQAPKHLAILAKCKNELSKNLDVRSYIRNVLYILLYSIKGYAEATCSATSPHESGRLVASTYQGFCSIYSVICTITLSWWLYPLPHMPQGRKFCTRGRRNRYQDVQVTKQSPVELASFVSTLSILRQEKMLVCSYLFYLAAVPYPMTFLAVSCASLKAFPVQAG